MFSMAIHYSKGRSDLSHVCYTAPFPSPGRLTEAYDELGNRYVIPPYCLNKPTNMLENSDEQTVSSSQSNSLRQRKAEGEDDRPKSPVMTMTVKVRLSTQPKDIKVSVLATDRVRDLKRKLQELHHVDRRRVTMLYSGRVLNNSTLLKDLDIPKGFVIQAIVS